MERRLNMKTLQNKRNARWVLCEILHICLRPLSHKESNERVLERKRKPWQTTQTHSNQSVSFQYNQSRISSTSTVAMHQRDETDSSTFSQAAKILNSITLPRHSGQFQPLGHQTTVLQSISVFVVASRCRLIHWAAVCGSCLHIAYVFSEG